MKQRLHGAQTQVATLVEMLRVRAASGRTSLAYRFLKEEKGEEICWDLRPVGPAGPRDRRPLAGAGGGRRAGPVALSAGLGLHRRVLRLPVCRRRGRAGVSAAGQQADAPRAGHRGRLPGPRGADHLQHPGRLRSAASSRRPTWPPCSWISTDDLPADLGRTSGASRTVDDRTLAFLQYTSGSTGDPKGVMVTPRQPAAQPGDDPSRVSHRPARAWASPGCPCTTTWA